MHRFFIESGLHYGVGNRIDILNKDDVKHISKVLRMRVDELIEICDGNNKEYICKILDINNQEIKTEVVQELEISRESKIKITLFQSLPKGQKMELILQKSVELGVHSIVPVITDRCISIIKDAKTEKNKLERWQKIIDEASKQSKRGIVPQITSTVKLSELNKNKLDYDLILMPHVLGNQKNLKEVLKSNSDSINIAIFIGPEGGFTEDEVEMVLNWGAIPITLGPRILRTETAGFVTSSVVMYELGDIGG